jgi:3-hydroxyisobutyrate dehydrogenase-like beta-hydroxyacid dehydrogenase
MAIFLNPKLAVRNASKVGFVGLGVMGSNMARNLIEKGRELVVYDVNDKATDQAVKSGKAVRVNSPKEVAQQCDGPVFTMLPNNQVFCFLERSLIWKIFILYN